jgi:hypothetical protein
MSRKAAFPWATLFRQRACLLRNARDAQRRPLRNTLELPRFLGGPKNVAQNAVVRNTGVAQRSDGFPNRPYFFAGHRRTTSMVKSPSPRLQLPRAIPLVETSYKTDLQAIRSSISPNSLISG